MTRFANSAPIQDFLVSTENYGDIAAQVIRDFNMQNLTAMQADGLIAKSNIEKDLIIDESKIYGAATRSAGRSAGDASMFSGAISGLGSLALGGIKAGQKNSYGGYGSTGGSGNTFNKNSVSKYGDAVQNPMDSLRNINAFEEANPFTSMKGNSYNNFSGWTDPANGKRY